MKKQRRKWQGIISILPCPKGHTDEVRLHKVYRTKNQHDRRQFYCEKCERFFAETVVKNNGIEYRSRYKWEEKLEAAISWCVEPQITEIADKAGVPRKTIYRWFKNMCQDKGKIKSVEEMLKEEYKWGRSEIKSVIKKFVKKFKNMKIS